MRTRNQSKCLDEEGSSKRKEDKTKGVQSENGCSTSEVDHDPLHDKSRKGVGRPVKRANSRGSSRSKRRTDSHLNSIDSDAAPEIALTGKDEQKVKPMVACNTLVSENLLPEKNADEGSTHFHFPNNEEDAEESDWEDGDITISDSQNHQPHSVTRDVIVEFDDSPCSSKQKPVRRASAEDKEMAELVHKAHLLCLLARGRLVDSACSDPLIQAALLSLVPTHLLKVAEGAKFTANDLRPIANWFHDNFHVRSTNNTERPFRLGLATALEKHEGTAEEVAALSVALFRSLNLTTRFVAILDVASLKPDTDTSGCSTQDATRGDGRVFNSSTLMVAKSHQVSLSPAKSSSRKEGSSDDVIGGTCHRGVCGTKKSISVPKTDKTKSCHVTKLFNDSKHDPLAPGSSSDISEARPTKKPEGSKRRGDLEFELQLEMAIAATAAGARDSKLHSEPKDSPCSSSHLSSPFNRSKRIKTVESSDSPQGISTAIGSKKVGAPLYWAEVFCSGENLTGKWVHVDAVNAIIDGEDKVEAAASACRRSLRYVVAFAGNGAKDVTRRYCMKWYKISSKRINSAWWDGVLTPLKELESAATAGLVQFETKENNTSTELDNKKSERYNSAEGHSSGLETRKSLEDMELETRALTEPLPTNQQAYKNHHLYAIERWLTKYQILHPKGPVLGYCSGHPVYPRNCVKTLHTKQRWLREGLLVKASESPAKVVKGSLKPGKVQSSEPVDEEEDAREGTIQLYGRWQMEPLVLPHARNGIVPKNDRGQVDVWSEKCLPHGTVHLRFPRIFNVAKRLGVDYAPAMVGFEFRNGRSIPVFEGIVVCSEFKEAIMEAYVEEEERREAAEKKRDEVQALSRWYQLLSSIITRQRLNETYGDDSSSQLPNVPNQKEGDSGKNEDIMMSQEQKQGYVRNSRSNLYSEAGLPEDHEHIFPIENQSFDEESSVRTKRCPCGFSVQVEEM